MDPENRNATDLPDVDENIDVDTLNYKYLLVGQYPAIGEWHFLVKRYVLQGVGELSGFRDVFPPKEQITEWEHPKCTRQGTTKVIYVSLQFMAAWIRHLKVKLPPMTGENWSKDDGM